MILQSQLQVKATNFGWNNIDTSDIINIPNDPANPNMTLDLIQSVSLLTTETISAWARNNVVNQPTRRAQNNYMMYLTLVNSLDNNTQATMELEKANYTIEDTHVAALYFKILMSKAQIDTQATIALTRTALTRLDEKMLELNSNISEFNKFVKNCRLKLNSRGADTTDLLIHLFIGYKSARDSKFVETIEKVEEDYLYGKHPDLTAEHLMAQALTAYQVRTEAKVWGHLTEEQEMIVAMRAEIKGMKTPKIKDKRLKLDTKPKKKKYKDSSPNTTDTRWQEKNSDNKTTISKNGITYRWCTHHRQGKGLWVTHTLEDCKNKKRDDSSSNSNSATETSSPQTQAVAAVAEIEDDGDSSSSDDSDSE